MGAGEHERTLLRSGLADDFDPGHAVEDEPDPCANNGMVIDKQDADIHGGNARPVVRPEQ
jgi:hypothetical protein